MADYADLLLDDEELPARPLLVAALLVPGGSARLDAGQTRLVATRGVSFYGEQMELVVATRAGEAEAPPEQPAAELRRLADDLGGSLRASMVKSCTWLWPLHDRAADAELWKSRLSVFVLEDVALDSIPCWTRWLEYLVLLSPPEGSLCVKRLRELYGNRCAYVVFLSRMFAQQLWALAAVAVVALCLQLAGLERACGELMNYGTLLWTVGFLWRMWSYSTVIGLQGPSDDIRAATLVAHRYFVQGGTGVSENCLKATALGFLTVLFAGGTVCLTCGYVQVLLWLTFDWGDCITLEDCEGPEVKHGLIGTIANVVLSICFGILIELVRVSASKFGVFAASWYNLEFVIDRQVVATSFSLWLQCVCQCAPLVLYGLLFVTPWAGAARQDSPEAAGADCSDLLSYAIVGKSAFMCLSRRIGTDRRRHIFRNMMTGPMLVTPFVRLLTKCWLPMLCRTLNDHSVSDLAGGSAPGCLRHLGLAADALKRLLGFIFVFDPESVGGLRFVTAGGPFALAPASGAAGAAPGVPGEGLEPEAGAGLEAPAAAAAGAAPVGSEEQLLRDALEEVKLRDFEPEIEIAEIKIMLVFVVMFSSIIPEGVFAMLLGRILESKLDVDKVLFVRRRPFPDQGGSVVDMHRAVRAFFGILIVLRLLWSLALSFIMYPTMVQQLPVDLNGF